MGGWPGWDEYLVYVAGTVWDGNRFPDQHMAERLARHLPVLYVDPPISRLSPLRDESLASSLEGPRLRQIGPGLARLTPVVLPGMSRLGMRNVTRVLFRRAVRRATEQVGGRVEAVMAGSLQPAFDICHEQRRVLYATDDFGAGGRLTGVDGGWLSRREVALAERADTLIVVSQVLADRWRARGHDPILVTNGVDDAIFAGVDDAPWPEDVHLPAPIVGFVGHMSERIDLSLLEAVAASGRSLLLVGPRQHSFDMDQLGALLRRPNVQYVGPKAFADLPSYLRAIDVGIVPYADSEFNQASFPLKTLEYLASGRAAVSTDLPGVRALDSPLVQIAPDVRSFVAEVEAAIATPRTDQLVAERRSFAATHGWDRKALEVAEVLGITA